VVHEPPSYIFKSNRRFENEDGSRNELKLLLYALRWQASTPILYLVIQLLPFGNLTKTIIANLIGSLIFFYVDAWIFNKKKGDKTV